MMKYMRIHYRQIYNGALNEDKYVKLNRLLNEDTPSDISSFIERMLSEPKKEPEKAQEKPEDEPEDDKEDEAIIPPPKVKKRLRVPTELSNREKIELYRKEIGNYDELIERTTKRIDELAKELNSNLAKPLHLRKKRTLKQAEKRLQQYKREKKQVYADLFPNEADLGQYDEIPDISTMRKRLEKDIDDERDILDVDADEISKLDPDDLNDLADEYGEKPKERNKIYYDEAFKKYFREAADLNPTLGSAMSRAANTRKYYGGVQSGDETKDVELVAVGVKPLAWTESDPRFINLSKIPSDSRETLRHILIPGQPGAIWYKSDPNAENFGMAKALLWNIAMNRQSGPRAWHFINGILLGYPKRSVIDFVDSPMAEGDSRIYSDEDEGILRKALEKIKFYIRSGLNPQAKDVRGALSKIFQKMTNIQPVVSVYNKLLTSEDKDDIIRAKYISESIRMGSGISTDDFNILCEVYETLNETSD